MANAFNMNLGAQSAPRANNPSMSALPTIPAYHDQQSLLRSNALERVVRFNSGRFALIIPCFSGHPV